MSYVGGYYGLVAQGAAAVSVFGRVGGVRAAVKVVNGGSVYVARSGTVSGALDGILTYHPAAITNFGSVNGTGDCGIDLANGGTVTNAASGRVTGLYGIYAVNASATVVNMGTVAGSACGAYLLDGGSLANLAGASVGGGIYGVFDGDGTVTNSGSVSGRIGVYLEQAATLSNRAGGTVSGDLYGVRLREGSSLANMGVVSSTSVAVDVRGSGYVRNCGTVTGSFAGILGYAGSATVSNAGIVEAALIGIDLSSGKLSNSGTVTGGSAGVILGSGMVANSGTVGGRGIGVYVLSGTATNAGSIVSQGIGVGLGRASMLSNAAGATVAGYRYGVTVASGGGTVVNAGTLGNDTATYFPLNPVAAILANGSWTVVTNALGGLVQGNGAGILARAGGVSLTNAAYFVTGGSDVYATGRSTVINSGLMFAGFYSDVFGGYVRGNAAAVRLGGGLVRNSGFIWSWDGPGVSLASGGTVTSNGTIDGASAIAVTGGAGTVANYGVVDGGYFGVSLASGGRVVNAGTIRAEGRPGTAILISGTPGYVLNTGTIFSGPEGVVTEIDGSFAMTTATAVDLQAGGTFVNLAGDSVFGTVQAGQSASATITNSGTVSSQPGTFAVSIGKGVVSNTGWLSGVAATGFATVSNSGTVTGGVTLSAGGTVSNAGVIAGSAGGYGVSIRGGSTDVLALAPGATISGGASGGGTGAIDLLKGASAGTLGSAGIVAPASYVGFSTVNLAAGANWVLAGSAPAVFLGGGGDTLTVAGPAPSRIVAAAGADTINLGAQAASATIVEAKGAVAGDVINGFAASDTIQFTGFGSGASVVQVAGSNNQWRVGTASVSETITVNGASLKGHFTLS